MFDRLIQFLIDFARIFMFWAVIPSYGRGVVMRLGKFHRIVDPGFHWKWPLEIETVISTNVVPETMMIGPQSLTTKDEVSVVISTVVTFGIEDVRRFLLDIEGANQVIEDAAFGIVARTIMEHTWPELMAMDLSNELTKTVRRQAKKYGVEIVQVQIADFTRSRSLRLVQAYTNHFTPIRSS